MKVYVIVATVGRAELTYKTVDRLADQTRQPDGVIVVSVTPQDVAGVERARSNPQIVFAERGLCNQRNKGLDMIDGVADIVIFFDDDFMPAATYLEEIERLFIAKPDVVGITGRVIADGIHGQGYSFEEGATILEKDTPSTADERPISALYGCNMSIRMSAVQGLRFDPALPLYGWQEDIDFTYQVGRRGRNVKAFRPAGVHLGSKGGRTSGLRLGYSQIANPLYMLRKKSIPVKQAIKLLYQPFLANLLKSIRPEHHVDRRGRLRGNLVAIVDVVLGRIDPRKIERM
ncbi:glycosyltransferase family 2 protein [Sphingomonas crocodyli]|uniref:Glycosyltransferase family 2 protein n=1 Tax=Sphingomonas crocodyli TaxID=1979270 RepID=A0A437LXQ8_9SPHN|nr:glycosyltransferase family 2 protein [Sphingomonas crocodyli]RVT90142.1 glycosyltransferase family 2 protein [Sphingomonas crocodyli]